MKFLLAQRAQIRVAKQCKNPIFCAARQAHRLFGSRCARFRWALRPFCVGSVALGLLLAGSLAQPWLLAAGQKASSPDDRISDQVRMKLATDPDVKGGALDVTVNDGVVTIKGRVDTDKGKTKAEKLAKKVKGVKQVDNELTVGPPR